MLKQFLIRLLFYYEILSDTPRAVEDAPERTVNPSSIRMSNSIKINATINNCYPFSLNCVSITTLNTSECSTSA